MELLAANGTAVGLVGPKSQAGIVQRMAANLDLGYMVVFVLVFPGICDAGGCAEGAVDGVGVVLVVGIVLGGGGGGGSGWCNCVYFDRCGGLSRLT